VAERQLPKLYVEGSIPFARSNIKPHKQPGQWKDGRLKRAERPSIRLPNRG
jgi:hypothetical protein